STHKRAYAAVVRDGVLRVVIERGLQGMPKLPGMSPLIRENAHALALGKVVLALSPPEAVERYVANGLRPFTPSTITTRDELDTELREIRRTGIAVEREEFDGDFCCIAAPVLDAQALRGRRGHLDVASRVRRGAVGARGDRERRLQIPGICGCPGCS